MNEAEELARLVSEIRETFQITLAVQTPTLPRPKVAQGAPATEELAKWSMRVYAYSLLCQFREVLDSTLLLFDSGHVPAVFLCCRSLFEMAAHSYYTKKWAVDHLRKKNYDAAWDFMLGINQGSRYMKDKYKKLPPIELVEGPRIGAMINTFNEYFNEHGNNEAWERYSFLSEFCHPDSFAFTNHIDSTEKKDDVADRRGSDRGGLSEDGNFFAQSHLQQFDFKQATAHCSVHSIWVNFRRQAHHSEDVCGGPFGIDGRSFLLIG